MCVLSYRHIYSPYIYIFHKCWGYYKNKIGWIRAFFIAKVMWPSSKLGKRLYQVGHSASSLSFSITLDDQRNGRLCLKIKLTRASLVAQWLRVCLPMQGTRVQALVQKDPICCGAAKPVCHNYWARKPRARAPQQEKPPQWEARAPQRRAAPTHCN